MTRKERKEVKVLLKPEIRPRPLLGPFHGPNGDYYIRRRDLPYFQLRAKYPLKTLDIINQKLWHPFRKAHHLKRNYWWENYGGYVIAGCFIVFVSLALLVCVVAFISTLYGSF